LNILKIIEKIFQFTALNESAKSASWNPPVTEKRRGLKIERKKTIERKKQPNY
jgi:hypothetical protein